MPTLKLEYWGLKDKQLKRIAEVFGTDVYHTKELNRTRKHGEKMHRFECEVPHASFDIIGMLNSAIGDYTCRIFDNKIE